MANRYWVGGTQFWNSTAGTKWATTSGGSGGASVPTSSDDVFFDANSGAVTVSTSNASNCQTLTCTGFTGTLFSTATSNYIRANGNVVLGSGMTCDANISFSSIGPTASLTSNGVTINGFVSLATSPTSDTLSFVDTAVITGTLSHTSGTLDFNDQNVSCFNFSCTGISARVVHMGSGTLTLTGTGEILKLDGLLTFNAETSTIKATDTSSSAKNFDTNGETFNNFWISGGGSGIFTVEFSNTFNEFKIDPGSFVAFSSSTTQTVSDFDAVGTSGNTITLLATSEGEPFILSKSSGTIDCDYLELIDSTATGGATWNAGVNSIDGGGNTGWTFSEGNSINGQMFLVF